jgi:hypothetical protein
MCPTKLGHKDARVHYTILKQQPGHTPTRHVPREPNSAPTSKQSQKHPAPQKTIQHATPRDAQTNYLPVLPRKEVIQPHLPVRLPCYDFVPIASPTFDHSPPKRVRPWASGVTDFHDVTGGVYKARERIHRSTADLRLLATPTSRGRVADPDPN